MRVISDEQARAAIPPERAITILREALSRPWRDTVSMPVRTQYELAPGRVLLCMPCSDSSSPYYGTKLVSVTAVNACRAEVNATYLLFSCQTSQLIATIEAKYLTDARTAAISAIVTDQLARRDAEVLGIFGTGRQACAHLVSMRRIRRFRRVLVCGSTIEKAEQFSHQATTFLDTPPEPVTAEQCARESDVICTCSTSTVPLFHGAWLRPGCHLNLIGAFRPSAREVDDATIIRSKIVVDTLEAALQEAGDLLIPIQSGVFAACNIATDVYGLLALGVPVRTADADITLFKSLGFAYPDFVLASALLHA
jgi:ornithine cyclodeaminase/alanine dehydrogenase-like protein (mu-crystallin family)